MTDNGSSTDLEQKLRDKIEQELEKRRQARQQATTSPDSNDPVPGVTPEPDAEADASAAPEPEAVDGAEEPTTESPAEPDVAEVEADEEPIEVVPVAETDGDETGEPEDDVPEVPMVSEVVDEDERDSEPSAEKTDKPAEPSDSSSDADVAKDAPAEDGKAEDSDNDKASADADDESGKDSDKESADKNKKKPTGKTATGLARSKKTKVGTRTGKNKTRATIAGGKGKGRKTLAGGRTTKGPSTTRSLSEGEQKLLDEKAKIDAKFRKQKMILYPAITLGTLLLLGLMIPAAIYVRNLRSGKTRSSGGQTTQQTSQQQQQSTGTAPAPKPVERSVYGSMADLEKAADHLVTVQRDPGAAIVEIKRYQKTNLEEKDACETLVTKITEDHLEKGLGSNAWKDLQPQINLGMQSTNPDDVEVAIARLKGFGASHPKEYFLAEYMIRKMEARYAEMTGGLMP